MGLGPIAGIMAIAVAETGVDADFYIFRDRSLDAALPWDIIDGGMKTSFFKDELAKSLREEWTLPPKRQQENAKLRKQLGRAEQIIDRAGNPRVYRGRGARRIGGTLGKTEASVPARLFTLK